MKKNFSLRSLTVTQRSAGYVCTKSELITAILNLNKQTNKQKTFNHKAYSTILDA